MLNQKQIFLPDPWLFYLCTILHRLLLPWWTIYLRSECSSSFEIVCCLCRLLLAAVIPNNIHPSSLPLRPRALSICIDGRTGENRKIVNCVKFENFESWNGRLTAMLAVWLGKWHDSNRRWQNEWIVTSEKENPFREFVVNVVDSLSVDANLMAFHFIFFYIYLSCFFPPLYSKTQHSHRFHSMQKTRTPKILTHRIIAYHKLLDIRFNMHCTIEFDPTIHHGAFKMHDAH